MSTIRIKDYRKSTRTHAQVIAAIKALDLECFRPYFNEKTWMGDGAVDYMFQKYKNFLQLCATHGELLVPSEDIDELWHMHILDSIKYVYDCDEIFGFYFHHNPYLGKNGDRKILEDGYQRTSTLYENIFGVPYSRDQAFKLVPGLYEQVSDQRPSNCG